MQVVLWKNCVNSMQAAIMFSKCSPHYNLDLIQLTNLIAEEEGAPSVADIIGQPLVAAGVCPPILFPECCCCGAGRVCKPVKVLDVCLGAGGGRAHTDQETVLPWFGRHEVPLHISWLKCPRWNGPRLLWGVQSGCESDDM